MKHGAPVVDGIAGRTAKKGGMNAGQLKSLVERIEKLEEERGALSGDIREVYSEAKSAGYDTRIVRQVVRLRKMDKADRAEQEELLALYLDAVGG
jgi:uncharacterized protein (UPF0335 family)